MESHHNDKGKKLGYREMRRHKGGRERDREVKERGKREVR